MGKPVGSQLTDDEADALADRTRQRLLELWPDLANADGSIRVTEAAKRTGVGQSHMSQILRGSKTNRRAGIRAIVQLRYALSTPIDELLGLKPIRPRSGPRDQDRLRQAIREELQALMDSRR